VFPFFISSFLSQIDLKNVKTNKNKSPGFCDQERQGMSNILSSGFDDSYRRLYPDVEEYTYFGMRFNSYVMRMIC
jgi:exonuclease III